MRISYDNIIFSLQQAGGISVYWAELCKRIQARNTTIFYGCANKNIFSSNISTVTESSLSPKLSRYLPFMKKLPRGSIFHSSYYRIANQPHIINVTTVHDFTYEYYRSGIAKLIHSWQKGRAIKHSAGIICISENTKKDLLKFYPDTPESKIAVIYNGVDDTFHQLQNCTELLKASFPELAHIKYLLYVGDRSAYKNFNLAAQVKNHIQGLSIVIVGGPELSAKEKQLLGTHYYHYRGINSADLNLLYNSAFCLIYPSCYEGFGIPVIEAMRAGCPVVASAVSSIPEISGDAALLVNEVSVESLVDAVKYLDDDKRRARLIEKGLGQAYKFSWDRCFAETYSFYQHLVEKNIL